AHLFQTFNGHVGDQTSVSHPLGKELRDHYPDIEQAAMASWNLEHIVAYHTNKLIKHGMHVEPAFVAMFSVNVIQGSPDGLRDINAVMLSKTLAQTLFGLDDPINKLIKLDNKANLTVTAVYDDFSKNSEFAQVDMLTTWAYFNNEQAWVKESTTEWNNNSFQCFVLLKKQANLNAVNEKIKDLIMTKRDQDERISKPQLFLFPMSQWHLYSEFKEGINVGGLIQFVWLFSLVGGFVLLLACINFMNLSTARSEKRAKEVGIRKAVGSLRSQLAGQFLSESVLTVAIAFGLALGGVALLLPAFNDLAAKHLLLPWRNGSFWFICLGFIAVTSFLAGSYPALYLSSFDPVRVLKGLFRVGRLAALPRKVLVVLQFTVSVALIIGTLVVYEQIRYGKNRPVGYDRNGLLAVTMNTPDLQGKYNVLRADLLATGVVANMSGSSSPLTDMWSNSSGYTWEGKEPTSSPLFSRILSTHEHAQTSGFQFVAGRDFSKEFSTDTSAVILNEEAVKITRKDILGKYITEPSNNNKKFLVIGIIKNTITQSPYEPTRPAFYFLSPNNINVINVKIKPAVSARAALPKIESVFRRYNPG
ncbi:MAG: ABC transporter permease, partial [Cytophagaceae bacterium]